MSRHLRDLSSLSVGQQVAITNWRYSLNTDYKVKRITPTGFVVVSTQRAEKYENGVPVAFVENELKFNKHNQCLTEFYKDYSIRADLDVIKEENRQEQVKKDAAVAILNAVRFGEHTRHTHSKESLLRTVQEMEAELAKARAWIEQI